MTDPAHDCPLCAANRARLEAIAADDAAGTPGQPWDEAREAEIAAIAESFDPESGWHRARRTHNEETPMSDACPHCHGIGLVAVFEGDVPVDERCGTCGGTGEGSEW